MTAEDHKTAEAAIASLPNHSAYQRWLIKHLRRVLAKRPGEFWEIFLGATTPHNPEAADLLRSGAINEESTLADLARLTSAKGGHGTE